MSDLTTEHDEVVVTVPKLSYVRVPIYALRGAISCCASEESRPALCGVYVHREDNAVRVVSSDGHRLFVASLEYPEGVEMPDWLDAGVIIPAEALKPRVSLIEKLENTTAIIGFAKNAPKLLVSDPREDCVFKMNPVMSQFPEYQRMIEASTPSFSREVSADFVPVGYDAAYLKDVGALAKLLESENVRVYSSTETAPSVIVFDSAPGVVLYLMPKLVKSPLAPQTARVLAAPIKGTLAALRAHQTRHEQRLNGAATEAERNEILDKIEEYKKRIAAVIANASPAALPAPAAAEPEISTDDLKAALEQEPAGEKDAEAEALEVSRAERARLTGKKLKSACRDFLRHVRAKLRSQHGLEDTAADAGVVDRLFLEGYSLEQVVAKIAEEHAPEPEAEQTGEAEAGQAEADAGEQSAEPGTEVKAPELEPAITIMSWTRALDLILDEKTGGHLLHDETPLQDWFDAGLTPEQAAERVIDGFYRLPDPKPEGEQQPEGEEKQPVEQPAETVTVSEPAAAEMVAAAESGKKAGRGRRNRR